MPNSKFSSGFEMAARLSADTDAFIGGRLLIELIAKAQLYCDIVALGGYGRRELCPASDIDLLFLFAGNYATAAAEEAVRTLVYPLWDRGLTVGLSVRTVAETLKDAASDPKLYAAMLDARLICGSALAYQDLAQGFEKMTRDKARQRFVNQLAKLNAARRANCGDARYQLEPNLKEGALRDYHCVRWYANLLTGHSDLHGLAAAGYLSKAEADDVITAADFLIAARYQLHGLTGRKTDKLSLDVLPEVCRALGYADEREFMRQLHQAARQLRYACEACEEAIKPAARRLSRWRAPSEPGALEELELIASGKARASHRLRRRLSELKPTQAVLNNLFNKVLTSPGAVPGLSLMLEAGLLELAVPVFKPLIGLSTFDPAHTYTVDLHSLKCLEEIIRLMPERKDVFELITDQGLLRLAALLHDVGKGSGMDHSLRGAELSRAAALELGFSVERAAGLAELVTLHLKLADQSLSRDLSDESTVEDFARLIRTPENLAMLYALTIADTRATAPGLWSAWRASLIDELYTKTRHLLQNGEAAGQLAVLNARWQNLATTPGRLWSLPQAYVLCFEPDEIRTHLALSAPPLAGDEIRLMPTDRAGHTALTICARERLGLFADLSGLLALNDFKIMSARIFSLNDGTCIDHFDVKPPWEDFDAWDRLVRQYRELASGKLDLAARLKQKKACQVTGQISASLDNRASDFYTLLRLDAPEAVLHAAARTLSIQGLNIHRAYLASRGSSAVMTFYLSDAQGEKLPDEPTALMHALARLNRPATENSAQACALRPTIKRV